MCGIAGYWSTFPNSAMRDRLGSALDIMARRGPDDRGVEWICLGRSQVGLGHARLSVIDLSSGGHQPMRSADGRYSIVFNGEIYNYVELRSELVSAGAAFCSKSDTEVLLAAWEHWGTDCIRRLSGMFAFAVIDRTKHVMTFVRDAFGIKPLFVAQSTWGWCFASELQATAVLRGEGASINLQTAYDYLVHGEYDASCASFIHGIFQLAPGTSITLDLENGQIGEPLYWWKPPVDETNRLSFDDAAAKLRELFMESVRMHLRSDVPLGATLSGGVDSSAVVCAMRKLEPDAQIDTFSFVARGTSVSEAGWVQAINRKAGAVSHLIEVEPHELARDLDDMIVAQGEPFGSTSIYAQYRVFQLARENGITVTLDGQGADELLAGYHGFPGPRLYSLISCGRIGDAISFLRHWSNWPNRQLSYAIKSTIAEYFDGAAGQMLRELIEGNLNPDWIDSKGLSEQGVRIRFPPRTTRSPRGRKLIGALGLSATRRGLPALLRHADRNSMRFSIENRVPFLTTALADYLLSLPEHFLISSRGETKHLFRTAMRGLVPDPILDRRDKIGFATPEQEWLTELAKPARDWLREDCGRVGFLHENRVLKGFDSMIERQQPFSWQAWRWINFVRWYSRVLLPLNAQSRRVSA